MVIFTIAMMMTIFDDDDDDETTMKEDDKQIDSVPPPAIFPTLRFPRQPKSSLLASQWQ